MKKLFIISAFVVASFAATSALAWNYEDLWSYKADAARPGGGGNFGTGSKTDRQIQCIHCHPPATGTTPQVNLALTFNPPLGTANKYTPNTAYQVTATMQSESLGLTDAGGPQNGNVNNIGIMFENAAGQVVGALQSDSGQTQSSCPQTMTATMAQGLLSTSTTVLVDSCKAVLGRGRVVANLTSWKFTWTAPAAGTGTVTAYWGVVDGNHNEDSVDDAAKMGTMTLTE